MSVHLHIEELVLDGFAQGDRTRFAAGIQSELTRLLTERGGPDPAGGDRSVERLDAGSFTVPTIDRSSDLAAGAAALIYAQVAG